MLKTKLINQRFLRFILLLVLRQIMCHFFTLKYNSVENKGDTMKKLISDYEDEKVDALIRKAVKEEAENINAPDRIKEEIPANM